MFEPGAPGKPPARPPGIPDKASRQWRPLQEIWRHDRPPVWLWHRDRWVPGELMRWIQHPPDRGGWWADVRAELGWIYLVPAHRVRKRH